MKGYYFWAQALDNTTPDHFYYVYNKQNVVEVSECKNIIELIARVTKSGEVIYGDGRIKLIEKNRQVVIEVPTIQCDNAGRVAAVVSCFNIEQQIDDAFIGQVISRIDAFAQHINRTILLCDLEMVKTAMRKLNKRYVRKRRILLFISGTGIVVSIAIALHYFGHR